MDKNSAVDVIFEDIKLKGIKKLEEFIEQKQIEDLYIDFKTSGYNNSDYTGKNSINKDDRDNLGKAISGFSNTEGGLIVWGIETGKDDEDYAKNFKEIKNIKQFSSLIQSTLHDICVPPNMLVESLEIHSKENPNNGFVITKIPKSKIMPHHYKGVYYIRSGGSFVICPHSVLMGIFGKDPQSNINLDFDYSERSDNNTYIGGKLVEICYFTIKPNLVNNGLGIASNVFLTLKLKETNNISINNDPHYNGFIMTRAKTKDFLVFNFNLSPEITIGSSQIIAVNDFYFAFDDQNEPHDLYFEILCGSNKQQTNGFICDLKKEKIKEMLINFRKDKNGFVQELMNNLIKI